MAAPKVDVSGSQVLQALVIAVMVIMLDEGFDLHLQVTGQEVVFQQDAVLEGLMPALDLALCLGVIRCPARVRHAVVVKPLGKFAGDRARTIIG